MRKITALLLVLTFCFTGVFSQDRTASFDGKKMIERVKRLSADDFEGRGPGTDGGRRAAQYIADELKSSGVKPGNKSSYFQNVKLVGVKADPQTVLRVGANGASNGKLYKFGDDFVATTGAQTTDVSVNAEVVFVGYGIDIPLYSWNDYKGSTDDFRGKVLMMLVNDPPATAAEPTLFGGKALTYYGRWTYKYEEAARRGAAGVILVHTTESAGYGWNVVRTSNGNWRYEIARTSADKTPFLQFKSWATNETAGKILAQAKLNIDDLREKAKRRDFQPDTQVLHIRAVMCRDPPDAMHPVPTFHRVTSNNRAVHTSPAHQRAEALPTSLAINVTMRIDHIAAHRTHHLAAGNRSRSNVIRQTYGSWPGLRHSSNNETMSQKCFATSTIRYNV